MRFSEEKLIYVLLGICIYSRHVFGYSTTYYISQVSNVIAHIVFTIYGLIIEIVEYDDM